jgi:hypothetical protein
MFTRLPIIALSLGSLLLITGCDAAPFDYYPHHETAVACNEIHKGIQPGAFGGFTNKYTPSTAGTNPSTGPASAPTSMSTGN